MNNISFFVSQDFNGKTVYQFLKHSGFSERMVRQLRKQAGKIIVNGATAKTNQVLCQNDELTLPFINNLTTHNTTPNAKHNTTNSVLSNIAPLDIVYEDELMLIVNKPAGLPCIPTRSHYELNFGKDILAHLLKSNPNAILRLPFRLDLDTAGLLFAYKNQLAFSVMKQTSIQKTYHALVNGKVCQPLTINAPIETVIKPNGINEQKRVVSPHGKHAVTHIVPIASSNFYSLIQAKIETGRTHQIRVHCSHSGFPLVGDKLYGSEHTEFKHTALVCKTVCFVHPVTKQHLQFEINYPPEWQAFINHHSLLQN